jgi:hypothetical protein
MVRQTLHGIDLGTQAPEWIALNKLQTRGAGSQARTKSLVYPSVSMERYPEVQELISLVIDGKKIDSDVAKKKKERFSPKPRPK